MKGNLSYNRCLTDSCLESFCPLLILLCMWKVFITLTLLGSSSPPSYLEVKEWIPMGSFGNRTCAYVAQPALLSSLWRHLLLGHATSPVPCNEAGGCLVLPVTGSANLSNFDAWNLVGNWCHVHKPYYSLDFSLKKSKTLLLFSLFFPVSLLFLNLVTAEQFSRPPRPHLGFNQNCS